MTVSDQYNKIKNNFYDKTKINILPLSTFDCFSMSVADGIQDAYDEIENNKYPYFFTNLSGTDLDSFGILINLPREPNESDNNYRYRINNIGLINESSNSTAIAASILNLKYASHATYVPLTYGCGTASIYIIPTSYDSDTIQNAIKEVKEKISNVGSPGSYIDYIIPTLKKVKLIIKIQSNNGDLETIKKNIYNNIEQYINNIAINDYLSIGQINKIGINKTGVDYFYTSSLFIDDVENINLQLLQTVETKFVLDNIIWI